MTAKTRRRVKVSKIPEDVQSKLADAHPEISTNDFVTGVLSRRYGFGWDPSGSPAQRDTVGDSIIVKVPEPLWIELKKEAMPYSTMSAVIIKAIREDT